MLNHKLLSEKIDSFKFSRIALAVAAALYSSSVFAESGVDDSTNPPSFNGSSFSNNFGSWQDITIKNDQLTDSPDGITLFPSGDGPFDFNVDGNTDIYLVSKGTDEGSAGGVTGIDISSSNNAASDDRVISASFNNLDIYAKSQDPQIHKVKGIWIYGGNDMVPGSPDNPAPSSLTVNGDTKIQAFSTNGYAIGINVGDELGNQNGLGTGKLFLKGNKNEITVEQDGLDNEGGWARASGGIIASNRTYVELSSQVTDITTRTAHVGSLAAVQGGIILDRNSQLKTTNTVNIDSTSINANSFNILYGISLDYIASCMYQSELGSVANLNGETNVILRTNSQTIAYGLVSYGKSLINAGGLVSVRLDDSQKNIGGINRFGAVYAGSTYTKLSGTSSDSYIDNMYGGKVELNNGLIVSLPKTMKNGRENVYALVADGESSKKLQRDPCIDAIGDEKDLYQLNGNINADRDGRINLTMANGSSYLTGWADNHATNDITRDGFINIALKNNAVWNVISKVNAADKVVSGNSSVDTLELNGGTLNMAYASREGLSSWEDAGHRQVLNITGTENGYGITGNNGKIWMDINLADEGNTESGLNLDQIIVNGKTEGTHSLAINFVNGLTGISSDKFHSENWLISQNSGSMTLTGPDGKDTFTGRGMVSMWSVRFVPEGEESKLDTDVSTFDNTSAGKPNEGKGYWYLVREDKWVEDNPDPVLPPEVDTNLNIGT
ncbi:hypothetical protein, partial [uncultured Succinatimonas sp.]